MTPFAKTSSAEHHTGMKTTRDFEADPRVPEGCAMTLTVKKLESLATMLGFAIKEDVKLKTALHFTLQASTRIYPLRANCVRSVPHHGGNGKALQRPGHPSARPLSSRGAATPAGIFCLF